MATNTLELKAHELIENLDSGQLAAVVHLLEVMLDEEGHLIEEDARRLREGRDWLAQNDGKGIPMEEVLAEFGLTMKDFPLPPQKAQ
ncbi:MAG: hypothetical protein ACRD34_09975 [Bryobacteraceae bacterium]